MPDFSNPFLCIAERNHRYLLPDAANETTVFGVRLRWQTNHPGLEREIRRLIHRWESPEIPPTGRSSSAVAYVMPTDGENRDMGLGPFLPEPRSSLVTRFFPQGCLIQAANGSFGFFGRDRRNAVVAVPDTADLRWMADTLIEPVWTGVLMWHPPLYGLHGGAVARDGRAVLVVGDHRAGKSSLVAALVFKEGYDYVGDDLLLLDGRTLRIHGRPWRIELRENTWRTLWNEFPPAGGQTLNDKIVWDGRELFPARTLASAEPRIILFLESGDSWSCREISTAEVRRRMGRPIAMFPVPAVRRGYRSVFDAFARSVRGFALTVDYRLGILEGASRVATLLNDASTRPSDDSAHRIGI